MTVLKEDSVKKYGINNMRGERIKNVGNPLVPTDAMPWKAPNYTSTERDALTSIESGVIIFNTTTEKLNFYTGSGWEAITSA